MTIGGSEQLHVLVIEDDSRQREFIADVFKTWGGVLAEFAENAPSAFQKLKEKMPDVILMDLGLPEMDGFEICKTIRQTPAWRAVPIIMLTGRTKVSDKIAGLEMGADDYLTKPYEPGELMARIRAVLRRRQWAQETPEFSLEALRFSSQNREVFVHDQKIALTPKEFDLLALLIRNRGAAISKEEISLTVWDHPHLETSRTLESHIWSLRSKLGSAGDLIETVGKVGYRFKV